MHGWCLRCITSFFARHKLYGSIEYGLTIYLATVFQSLSFWWIWNYDLNIYHFLLKCIMRKKLCMQKVYRKFEDNKWYIEHSLVCFCWNRNSGNKLSANVDNKMLHWPPSAARERLNVISHNNHMIFILDTFDTEFCHYFLQKLWSL